jgi:hypothetical protein
MSKRIDVRHVRRGRARGGDLTNANQVMTTGYMAYFRSLTDGRPENSNTRSYTTAGTDWEPGRFGGADWSSAPSSARSSPPSR